MLHGAIIQNKLLKKRKMYIQYHMQDKITYKNIREYKLQTIKYSYQLKVRNTNNLK